MADWRPRNWNMQYTSLINDPIPVSPRLPNHLKVHLCRELSASVPWTWMIKRVGVVRAGNLLLRNNLLCCSHTTAPPPCKLNVLLNQDKMTFCSTLNDIKKCYLIQINPRLHMSWQQWAPLLFGRFFPVAPHQLYHRFVLMSSSTCLRRKDIVPDLVRRRTSCLSLLRIRLTYIGGKS